jgi:4-amino-4-deoxy-L-arabinose transferase-like glycosyltransferase
VRRTTVLILLLSALSFFVGLGRPAIGDSDEAFYAEAGREMVASGDWLTPHYNYVHRFQKPILFYWLVAGTYVVAGVGEAAARVWSAAAGLGIALLTAACARAWYDERTARLAGTVVATSFGYFSIGRLSLPDLPLAFFITLTTWTALRGLLDEVGRPGRWLLASGIAAGLGFLTKGPVAFVIPALVVLPAWLVEWGRTRLPVRELAVAALVASLVAAPWYVAMAQVHGQAYVEGFFIGDNVDRFATSRYNDPRPLWFYVPIVAGGMLPWTPLLVCALSPLLAWMRRRERPQLATLRLAIWAALPFLFFTASIGKQPRYVLPLLPPLAVLLALSVWRRVDEGTSRGGRRDPVMMTAGLLTGLLLVVLGALIYRAMPLIVMVNPQLVVLGSALIALAGVGTIGAALTVRPEPLPWVIAIAAAASLVGLQYGLSPAGRDPVQNMAALVLKHRQGDEPVATYRVFVRNLIFYTHLRQSDLPSDEALRQYLRGPDRVLCVITADELAKIKAGGAVSVRTLAEVLYFNASAVKLRTLLSPDPSRDLERVLLITNR